MPVISFGYGSGETYPVPAKFSLEINLKSFSPSTGAQKSEQGWYFGADPGRAAKFAIRNGEVSNDAADVANDATGPLVVRTAGALSIEDSASARGAPQILSASEGWSSSGKHFVSNQAELKRQKAKLVPSSETAKLLAAGQLLAAGELTPDSYLALTKGSKQAQALAEMFILGKPARVEIPAVLTLEKDGAKYQGQAELVIKRSAREQNEFFYEADPVSSGYGKESSAYCDHKPTGALAAGFCNAAAYRQFRSKIEYFITNSWRKEPWEDLPKWINVSDPSGQTPLMKFSSSQCAPEREIGASGFSSDLGALREKKKKAFAALLAAGAKIDAKDFEGRNALHYALMGGCLDEARALIQHGLKLSERDAHGYPMAAYAAAGDLPEMVKRALPFTKLEELCPEGAKLNFYADGGTLGRQMPAEGFWPVPVAIKNSPESLDLILALKPHLSDPQKTEIFRYLKGRGQQSEAQLKILAKYGVIEPPPIVGYKQVSQPGSSEPVNVPIYLGANQTLEAGQAAACNMSDRGRDSCLVEKGLCTQIKWPRAKDLCFRKKGDCNSISDPREKWRCEFKRGSNHGPIACSAVEGDTAEELACNVVSKPEPENFDYLRRALEIPRAAKMLMEVGALSSLTVSEANKAKLADICKTYELKPYLMGYGGLNIACAKALQPNWKNGPGHDDFRKKLASCGPNAPWSECKNLIFAAFGTDEFLPALKALNYYCAKGEIEACAQTVTNFSGNPVVSNGQNVAQVRERVCLELRLPRACEDLFFYSGQSYLQAKGAKAAKELGLVSFTEGGQTGAFSSGVDGLNRMGITESDISPHVGHMHDLCMAGERACYSLYDYYLLKGDTEAANKLDADIAQTIRWDCIDENSCVKFRHFAASRPQLQAVLNGLCAQGLSSACLDVKKRMGMTGGERLKEEDFFPECEKSEFSTEKCSSMATLYLEQNPGNSDIESKVCSRTRYLQKCRPWRTKVDDLAFNPKHRSEFESDCLKRHVASVCRVLAEHHLRSQPEISAKLYGSACEGQAFQGGSGECEQQLRLLSRLGKLKERNQALERYCNAKPEPYYCKRKEIYLLDSKTEFSKEKILAEECNQKNQNSCQNLYLLYQLRAPGWGTPEGKRLVCSKFNYRCEI